MLSKKLVDWKVPSVEEALASDSSAKRGALAVNH